MTARVRDELWSQPRSRLVKLARACKLWDTATEQGYAIRSHGNPSYTPIEFDGLTLIRHPRKERKDAGDCPF